MAKIDYYAKYRHLAPIITRRQRRENTLRATGKGWKGWLRSGNAVGEGENRSTGAAPCQGGQQEGDGSQ